MYVCVEFVCHVWTADRSAAAQWNQIRVGVGRACRGSAPAADGFRYQFTEQFSSPAAERLRLAAAVWIVSVRNTPDLHVPCGRLKGQGVTPPPPPPPPGPFSPNGHQNFLTLICSRICSSGFSFCRDSRLTRAASRPTVNTI